MPLFPSPHLPLSVSLHLPPPRWLSKGILAQYLYSTVLSDRLRLRVIPGRQSFRVPLVPAPHQSPSPRTTTPPRLLRTWRTVRSACRYGTEKTTNAGWYCGRKALTLINSPVPRSLDPGTRLPRGSDPAIPGLLDCVFVCSDHVLQNIHMTRGRPILRI
jgi:hypothetical protein